LISKVDRNLYRVIGSERFIECDTLLLSVGLIPENELTRETGARISKMGGLIVDNNLETTIERVLFVKFLRKFNLKNEFYNTLKEEGNIGFYLSEILPERLDLLQKDKCRIAYQLVNFDLFNIDKEGWEKNFCNRNGNCYIQQRHEIVHGGLPIIHEKTKSSQLEFIETALIDIVKFVLSIEDSTYQRISELEKKELEESSK